METKRSRKSIVVVVLYWMLEHYENANTKRKNKQLFFVFIRSDIIDTIFWELWKRLIPITIFQNVLSGKSWLQRNELVILNIFSTFWVVLFSSAAKPAYAKMMLTAIATSTAQSVFISKANKVQKPTKYKHPSEQNQVLRRKHPELPTNFLTI
jgi:hypothetical protein